jgi:hypothetical protein
MNAGTDRRVQCLSIDIHAAAAPSAAGTSHERRQRAGPERRSRAARERGQQHAGLDSQPRRRGAAQAPAPRGTAGERTGHVYRALSARQRVPAPPAPRRRGDPGPRGRVFRRARRLARGHLPAQPRRLRAPALLTRGLPAVRESCASSRDRSAATWWWTRFAAGLALERPARCALEETLRPGGLQRPHAPRALDSSPGDVGQLSFPHGAELFVLSRAVSATNTASLHGTHSWLRLPPGSTLTPHGSEPCELYIKEGGFPYLRAG